MNIINDPTSLQNWYSYEYIGPGHNFHAVHYEKDGGPDNMPFIWADDRMWSIDTPESPHSILPLLFYVIDIPTSPIDLRGAEIELCLRGENLDLKGGYCLFWILSQFPNSNRWHFISSPLKIAQGKWGKPNLLTITDNPTLWHNSFCKGLTHQPSLNKTLEMTTSLGISFINFKEKVTGRVSLGAFRIKKFNQQSPNWPYTIGKNKTNCGWLSICHHKKKQIPAMVSPTILQDSQGNKKEAQSIVCNNFLMFHTPITTFCYLAFAHADHTTKRHGLTNAVVLSNQFSIDLDLKKGNIHFFIEHTNSDTRWIYASPIPPTSRVEFFLSEEKSLWYCLTGKYPLKATMNEYDYFGFLIASSEETPTGIYCLVDFSIGPNL